MSGSVCKTCGKSFLAEHAGSFTAYMFQHNYCQCNKVTFYSGRKPTVSTDSTEVCKRCRKAIPKDNRAGSFTAFLFNNLRCQCTIPARPKVQEKNKRSDTAYRTAQRKQFTNSSHTAPSGVVQQAEFKAGDIVGGTFKINSVIGRGGMGVVYAAQQLALQRPFALKVLSPQLINEQTWKRFQAEAKMLASLHHATLVKVYDLGIHNQAVPFYSMDLLAGRTLERILADEGPLELSETIDIFLQVLDGLAYAHRNDIVHRDLKPANIMVSFAGQEPTVKILDFGISKLLRNSEQNLTVAGEVFGSPYYMSPEQCMGDSVDARSDIYSVGCALFETLTACIPFEGNSVEMVVMHEQDLPPLMGDVCEPDFPPSIEYVVAKCLEKRPDDRYQSAKEMAIDLRRIKSESGADSDYFLNKEPRSVTMQKALLAANTLPAGQWVKLLLLATVAIVLLASGALMVFSWWSQAQPESAVKSAEEAEPIYFSSREGPRVVFNFPDKQAIGKINYTYTSSNGKLAQNRVYFDTTAQVHFFTNDYLIHHPEVVRSFRPTDLHAFIVGEQAVETRIRINGIMPYVAKLTSLRVFSADNNRFSDDLMGYLNSLLNLKQLNLINSEVTAAGISAYHNWKDLDAINFAYNSDLTAMLAAVEGSENLTFLNIEAPEQSLSDADIKLLLTCKSLAHLNIMASDATDSMLLQLATMPKLKFVDVTGCRITPEAVKHAKALNNNLQIVTAEPSQPR